MVCLSTLSTAKISIDEMSGYRSSLDEVDGGARGLPKDVYSLHCSVMKSCASENLNVALEVEILRARQCQRRACSGTSSRCTYAPTC